MRINLENMICNCGAQRGYQSTLERLGAKVGSAKEHE